MSNDKVIDELLARVQALEEKGGCTVQANFRWRGCTRCFRQSGETLLARIQQLCY